MANFEMPVDNSGTWTDGLVVGSPEWLDASIKMDIITGLMAQGTDPGELMGIFDSVDTGENGVSNG